MGNTKGDLSMATSALEKLAFQAAAAEQEVRRLHQADGQLTPKAFVEAHAAVAGADREQAKRILAELETDEGFRMLAPSFSRLKKAMGDWRRSAPIAKFYIYLDAEADACLGRINCTRTSLALAAAIDFARAHKDHAGTLVVKRHLAPCSESLRRRCASAMP